MKFLINRLNKDLEKESTTFNSKLISLGLFCATMLFLPIFIFVDSIARLLIKSNSEQMKVVENIVISNPNLSLLWIIVLFSIAVFVSYICFNTVRKHILKNYVRK